MKAALAILLIFIGGFLLYEVLSGNASTILTTLQTNSGKTTQVQPSGNTGGGGGGSF